MKRYKLLKDTPNLKAGAIFEEQGNYDDDKELVQVVSDGCLTKPWFAVSDIDNFDDWFEEVPGNKRWRAKYGEEYWCIGGNGHTCHSTEDEHSTDSYRFCAGNYFKTEEEAETYKKYFLARQVLLDDAEGGKYSYGEENWCTYYSKYTQEWTGFDNDIYHPGMIYFRTGEALQKSLEEHKEQWETVRKYEMWNKNERN